MEIFHGLTNIAIALCLSFSLPYAVGNRKKQTWKAQAVLLKLWMEPEIFSTLTLLLCQLWKRARVASRYAWSISEIFSSILILTHCYACSIKVLTCTGWPTSFLTLVAHRSSTEESSSSDCSLSGETHRKPVLTSSALLRYLFVQSAWLYCFMHGFTLLQARLYGSKRDQQLWLPSRSNGQYIQLLGGDLQQLQEKCKQFDIHFVGSCMYCQSAIT